jgi:sporulation protein YlmC with PRC-barrel domain
VIECLLRGAIAISYKFTFATVYNLRVFTNEFNPSASYGRIINNKRGDLLMYKGKNIIGKTLVAFDSGKVLNTVSNIAYNPNTGRILGLLIDETLLLAKGRHVPLSEIRTIGEDAITIINEDSIITWDENPLVREFGERIFK